MSPSEASPVELRFAGNAGDGVPCRTGADSPNLGDGHGLLLPGRRGRRPLQYDLRIRRTWAVDMGDCCRAVEDAGPYNTICGFAEPGRWTWAAAAGPSGTPAPTIRFAIQSSDSPKGFLEAGPCCGGGSDPKNDAAFHHTGASFLPAVIFCLPFPSIRDKIKCYYHLERIRNHALLIPSFAPETNLP